MTIFSDVYRRVVDDTYIQAIEEDKIKVQKDIIEKAKQGDREAIHTIGCVYAAAKNKDKAIKWLGTSSAMGLSESRKQLGIFYKSLHSNNNDIAMKWFEHAGINGSATAFAQIGDIYFEQKQYEKARELFEKSAALGDAYGQYRLGEYHWDSHYINGKYTEQNYPFALAMFRLAAAQNNYKAYYRIGEMYEFGYGVDRDYYQALRSYVKSCEGGYEVANRKIVDLNQRGFYFFPTDEDVKRKNESINRNATDDNSPPTYNEAAKVEYQK